MEVTIFEQDGHVYTALSHNMPVRELARETAKAIRSMHKIPRARMGIVPLGKFMKMPFAAPKKI